jgi:hypothetical protein
MCLDSVRQMQFNALCHCFGGLLEHHSSFDNVGGQGGGLLDLLDACVNVPAIEFGRDWKGENGFDAIRNLHKRITCTMQAQYPDCAILDHALKLYGGTVLNEKADLIDDCSVCDLPTARRTGEELSKKFFGYCCNSTKSPECLTTLKIRPARRFGLWCLPNGPDPKTIEIGFAPDNFSFDHFLNLPFFFFHEYASHLHAAPMYANTITDSSYIGLERNIAGSFEDGWLLYVEYDMYRDWLSCPLSPTEEILRSSAVDHYVGIFSNGQGSKQRRYFDLAKWFHQQVLGGDTDALRRFSAEMASRLFDHLGCTDFHLEILSAIHACRARKKASDLRALLFKLENYFDDLFKEILNFTVN